MKACHVCPNYNETKTITLIHDSIQHKIDTVTIIKKDKIFIEIPKTIPIDTNKIIQEYYTKNIVEREFRDSNLVATIKDTIYNNDIVGKSDFTYRILKPTTIINETKILPANDKLKVFAGFRIGADNEDIFMFHPEISMITKQDRMYGIGTDIVRVIDGRPNITFEMKWKISFKNK